MTEKNHFAKKLLKLVSLLPALLLGVSIGFVSGVCIDAAERAGAPFLLAIVLSITMTVLAFLVQIIIHEGGHLVFGLLSGYRFVSFSVMGFIWQKGPDGKLRMGRMQIAGAGGQCLMAPPEYNSGDFPFTLYNLGGVLMNIIASLLGILLCCLFPTPVTHLMLLPLIVIGLGFALMNGLPLPVDAIQNDGSNLVCIRKDAHARRAFWVQMSLAAELARGTRIKDMPEDWFAPFPDDAMDNPIVCAVAVMNTSRLMDQLDFPGALAAIRTLLARKRGVLDIYRMTMACDGAVCELVAGQPADVTATLDTPDMKRIMAAMKSHPAILRTHYALALLQEHDIAKATQLLQDFDKAAAQHPNPQEIVGEREIIAAIQNAAQPGGTAQ